MFMRKRKRKIVNDEISKEAKKDQNWDFWRKKEYLWDFSRSLVLFLAVVTAFCLFF